MTRRSRMNRHRAVVLTGLALFVLFQLVIGAGIDQASGEIRDPEFTAKLHRLHALRQRNPDSRLTLILGSSRCAYGFQAGSLGEPGEMVFNFAVPGSGPLMERIVFDRLRHAGIRPDRVILEVTPMFLNAAAGDVLEERMLDGARLSDGEFRSLTPYLVKSGTASRRWWGGRLLPVVRHQAELRESAGLDRFAAWAKPPEELDTIDASGWQSRPVDPTQITTLTGLAHRQYDRFYPAFRPADGPMRCLRGILRELRDSGVPCTLVVMPEASHFRELLTPESRQGFDTVRQELTAEFAFDWVDARDWVADDGFYDGHHLLPEGAETFTRRFAMRHPLR